MLTPSEIKSKELKKGLGYNKREVDLFLESLSASYETLYNENNDLKEKITMLNDGLQYYKSIEKTLQKALVLAQKTADENQAESLKRAKNIELEAKIRADEIVKEARNQLTETKEKTSELVSKMDEYKKQIKAIIKSQLDLLDNEAYKLNLSEIFEEKEEVIVVSEAEGTEEVMEAENKTSREEEPVYYLNRENVKFEEKVEGKKEDENTAEEL